MIHVLLSIGWAVFAWLLMFVLGSAFLPAGKSRETENWKFNFIMITCGWVAVAVFLLLLFLPKIA